MALSQLILEIAREWSAYRSGGVVASSAPAFRLVVNDLPAELRALVPATHGLKFKGSTGAGNITPAPWIATFDLRITDSATTGFYPVYLFSVDLQSVYLSLAFGTTQFTDVMSRSEALPRMRLAAARLQALFDPQRPRFLKSGAIDLAASRTEELHEGYEHSSVYHVRYDLDAMPSEEVLARHYVDLMAFYERIASDPLRPSTEELLESVVEPPSHPAVPVRSFEPRPPKQTGKGSGGGRSRRRSKESTKVGTAGERYVFEHEKQKLANIGLQVLADKVAWESRDGFTPGWDISSFDQAGESIFIEVKSTVGKAMNVVELTENEWRVAASAKHRDRYFLYLVTKALTHPEIEILKSPYEYVSTGTLQIRPVVFALSLAATLQAATIQIEGP